jgi:hypothetical protein
VDSTVIAGIVGGGSAVLAAGIATLGTYKVTSRSISGEKARDRDARLADTYIDLIWLVHSTMVRVESARPKVKYFGDPDIPVISPADEARIKARVQTIGSSNVRDRLTDWRRALNMFRVTLGILDEIAGGRDLPMPPGGDAQEWERLMSDLTNYRISLRALTNELEDAIRSEVAPDHLPSPDASPEATHLNPPSQLRGPV